MGDGRFDGTDQHPVRDSLGHVRARHPDDMRAQPAQDFGGFGQDGRDTWLDVFCIPPGINADPQAGGARCRLGEIVGDRVREARWVLRKLWPAITASIAATSSTLRPIGPTWSRLPASSNTP